MLLLLETDRRKKDDAKRKEKEAADKAEIQDMHARHVVAEEVRNQMMMVVLQLGEIYG